MNLGLSYSDYVGTPMDRFAEPKIISNATSIPLVPLIVAGHKL